MPQFQKKSWNGLHPRHSICKYTNGMNALCMVASITNVTTMAFDASNAAKPSQDQGLNEINLFG